VFPRLARAACGLQEPHRNLEGTDSTAIRPCQKVTLAAGGDSSRAHVAGLADHLSRARIPYPGHGGDGQPGDLRDNRPRYRRGPHRGETRQLSGGGVAFAQAGAALAVVNPGSDTLQVLDFAVTPVSAAPAAT
jgi:hypothetical protein